MKNPRRASRDHAEFSVVREPAATAYGPVTPGDLLNRMDPRFDTLGEPFTVPAVPSPPGRGAVLTATESFTWTLDGQVLTVVRGDQYRSDHPVVEARPDAFVRLEIPRLEQRDTLQVVPR